MKTKSELDIFDSGYRAGLQYALLMINEKKKPDAIKHLETKIKFMREQQKLFQEET